MPVIRSVSTVRLTMTARSSEAEAGCASLRRSICSDRLRVAGTTSVPRPYNCSTSGLAEEVSGKIRKRAVGSSPTRTSLRLVFRLPQRPASIALGGSTASGGQAPGQALV